MKLYFPGDVESKLGLLKWIADHIGPHSKLHEDSTAVAIGVVTDTGKEAAGVAFTNYLPDDRTIMVHLAACNPLWTRGTIVRDILSYPFMNLNVNKVWGATPIHMEHVLKVNKKMGFTREAVLREQFNGEHAVVTGLLRKEYMRLYWPELNKAAA